MYHFYINRRVAIRQPSCYSQFRETATKNIDFIGHVPQEKLIQYYQKATVHDLPGLFKTHYLATLETAAMHCDVVITGKGFVYEYFNDCAFYWDPLSLSSIPGAIDKFDKANHCNVFQQKVVTDCTWRRKQLITKLTKKYYMKSEI